MARRFRKSGAKRTAKRSRAMTNYAIATRTSAKAQSRQIYYLKRRINYIQRRTKPEVITVQQTMQQIALAITTTGNIVWNTNTTDVSSQFAFPYLGTINSMSDGSPTSNPPNNFARLLSFNLYGNLQYASLAANSIPLTLRIVIVQTRATRGTGLSIADVFTQGNAFNMTYGPLQTGLARTCKVLSDKRYQLSYQRPNITIKTSLKYLLPYYRDETGTTGTISENVPKGAIYVFYAVHTRADSSTANLNLMYKLAYTDA